MVDVRSYAHRVGPLLRISRPAFLALPVTLVVLGAAAATVEEVFDPTRTAVALIGLVVLHISVNALNEASDYESGIDERTDATPFSGGSKTLPDGHVEPRTAYRYGYLMAAIGALIGLWFLVVVGPLLIPVLVLGGVSVLAYTDYLTRYSLGELFAGLGLGGLPVLGTAIVQAGTVPTAAVVAAVPAFLLTFNLLLLNEFPDVAPDRFGNRKNLLHRFGRVWGGRLYALASALVPMSILTGILLGVVPITATLALLASVAAVRPVAWTLRSPQAQPPESVLRDNVVFILATNGLLAVGLVLPSVGLF
ncbi:MAG: prenyltransferase [Salinarchaeum sp.]